MSKVDFWILLPVVVGFVIGLFKGFVKEVASLGAILLGIYGAKIFAPLITSLLIATFGFPQAVALPVAWLVLFLIIGAGLLVFSRTLEHLFNSLSLGSLNKILGATFGALKFALVVSVLLVVFDALDSRFHMMNASTKQESLLYKPMTKLAPALWGEARKKY